MPREGKKQRSKKAAAVSQLMSFSERFNIQFLGSHEVTKPASGFSAERLNEALQEVLRKQRPCHAGTITITQQGIKWVKSGMFNGALYGINRVLFSGAHGRGPYFSFIVKDKTMDRHICHCFACEDHAQANGINSAIGKVFSLIAEEKSKAGGMRQLQERSRKFEESRLLQSQGGNLLSTPLDRGDGVDADEAMAVLDAGFDATGWSTPAVTHGGRTSLSADGGQHAIATHDPTSPMPALSDSIVPSRIANAPPSTPAYFCTQCGTRNHKETCTKCGAVRKRAGSNGSASSGQSGHSGHSGRPGPGPPSGGGGGPPPRMVGLAASTKGNGSVQSTPPPSSSSSASVPPATNNPFLAPSGTPPTPSTATPAAYFCTKCGGRNTGPRCTQCGATRGSPGTGTGTRGTPPTSYSERSRADTASSTGAGLYEEDSVSPPVPAGPGGGGGGGGGGQGPTAPAVTPAWAQAEPLAQSAHNPFDTDNALNHTPPRAAPNEWFGEAAAGGAHRITMASPDGEVFGEPSPEPPHDGTGSEYGESVSMVSTTTTATAKQRPGSVEYGEPASLSHGNDDDAEVEAIQFADPFTSSHGGAAGGSGGDAAMSTENADELWQTESAALEEAMRVIRERLEQSVPDIEPEDPDDLRPVQLSDLVSPTAIASNPFAALTSASLARSPDVIGEPKELNDSIGGITDLVAAYHRRCPDGPVDLRSEQTVEPEIKMCADSDMSAKRPSLTIDQLRPGASGFNTRVQVIQHLCSLDTSDAGKIVEWLVGDESGTCILKTVEPVGDRLHLGIWYDLIGAQVDVVSSGYMRLVVGHFGGTRIIKSNATVPPTALSNNVSAIAVSLASPYG
eukprot:m.129766 g.129766  ORF g.129766 m.129766 type:complete len:848 (+) comp11271_c1_seq1:70-2613(+)